MPSKVDELPASDYALLQRYWNWEPWGPYRDNIHAAIIATKVHNALRSKRTPKAKITDFLLVDRAEHKSRSKLGFINFMKALARK